MSLAEQISGLANPTPVFNDPEDTNDGAGAVVCEHYDEGNDAEQVAPSYSKLRQRASQPLADFDKRYAGKTVSRAKHGASNLSGHEDEGSEDVEDDDSVGTDSEEESAGRSGQTRKSKISLVGEGDDTDESMVNDEDSDDRDDADSGRGEEEEEGSEEDLATTDAVQSFSAVNIADEVDKGKAARIQLSLWDSFLEGRIKMQKILLLTNQLPHPTKWQAFVDQSDGSYKETLQNGERQLTRLLSILVNLQTTLLRQNAETAHVVTDLTPGDKATNNTPSDEEITSDSGDESKVITTETETTKSKSKKTSVKRKLKMAECEEILMKRHASFCQYRNNTIQKWYDKTQVSSGKLSKGFSSFEQSALKQIDQILSDQSRLIRRTQLRRSAYHVLGQVEPAAVEVKPLEGEEVKPSTDNSKDYEEEIFDDDDFYHQLLRELIERKTADINDPIALSRHWLEIQKLRSRVKKKVDTRASKGRKVRYDIHRKLMNFMAPVEGGHWTDESRNDLFKSLFSKSDLTTGPSPST